MNIRTSVFKTLVIALCVACGSAQGATLLEDFTSSLEIPASVPSRVYRFDLDVTKDGRPEVFLGTSYLGGAFGRAWAVYAPDESGEYRRFAILTFHFDGFYYSADSERFSVYVRVGPATGGFTRYRPTALGFEELTEPYGSLEEEQARVDSWRQNGRPPLYETTLENLRGLGTIEWKDADTGAVNPFLGRLSESVVQ